MLACKNKQTNKFAEWHYYYNDCYMILPYEKHDNFADQSMKTYKKWEKTTMLHTLHTTHYTIHTHTQYTLLYEYIQLWLWRNDQLLKTIRKIIKTCLFVVPRRYQIPLKLSWLKSELQRVSQVSFWYCKYISYHECLSSCRNWLILL